MEAHGPQLNLNVQSLVLRDIMRIVEEYIENGARLVLKALKKIQNLVYKETNVEKYRHLIQRSSVTFFFLCQP